MGCVGEKMVEGSSKSLRIIAEGGHASAIITGSSAPSVSILKKNRPIALRHVTTEARILSRIIYFKGCQNRNAGEESCFISSLGKILIHPSAEAEPGSPRRYVQTATEIHMTVKPRQKLSAMLEFRQGQAHYRTPPAPLIRVTTHSSFIQQCSLNAHKSSLLPRSPCCLDVLDFEIKPAFHLLARAINEMSRACSKLSLAVPIIIRFRRLAVCYPCPVLRKAFPGDACIEEIPAYDTQVTLGLNVYPTVNR